MAFFGPFDTPLSDGKRRRIILDSPRLAATSASAATAFAEGRG